ncbi:hypothetical protein BPAE_0289g00020 [Botrytis paeoniae]|uniref:DUF6604 domain-containing protein n=1 Tax=Botrytis paeoniae TaxID=278948 RepID=A0A4Z1FAG2_9HELO|nr:hypothetical protein BPAE_0289g00020 [Botrytis paeoniae]
MLEVEDVGAENLDVTTDDIITASKPKAKKHLNICEMEIEDKIDLDFIVFCFFEDLQRIQEFLKETWKLVVKEELDAITASLMSKLAFSLARQIENELTSSHPEFFADIPSYVKIAGILHEVNYVNDKLERQDKTSKRSTSGEFVYYSIFGILSKYLQYGQTQSDGAQCVIPISTLLSANDLAYEQTGRHVMPATASAINDWKNEDLLLSQILLDATNKNFVKYHHEIHFSEEMKEQRRIAERIISSPFEDEFTKGLMSTNKTGDIIVFVVFGARPFMDISKILGNGADWITSEKTQRAINLSQLIQQTVKDNALVLMKIRHLRDTAKKIPEHHSLFREFKQLQPETIWPSKDRSFYYNHNPVYCGLEWLRFGIKMEKEGIDLCNTFTSFFAVAHLYIALKQDSPVQTRYSRLMRIWLTQIITRIEIPYIKLTRQCSLLFLRIRETLNEELAMNNKNGLVDCAEANPKENILTVLRILGEAYGIEIWSDNARRNPRGNASIQVETPQLLIAARVTREFLVEIGKEEPIRAIDVPEALQLKRELSSKGQELQRRYLEGDQSAEVIDGLRRTIAEASI